MLKIENELRGKTKDEIFELCKQFKNKTDLFTNLKVSDNSPSNRKFYEILEENNIDIQELFPKKEKIYCLCCGKELSKWQKKFCSSSCSAKFNNKKRTIHKKTSVKVNPCLEDGMVKKEQKSKVEKLKRFCLYCGKELKTNQKKFCCTECSINFHKREHYRFYLENPEYFSRDNYTPKYYIRHFILEEQNHKCNICGSPQTHNGKPLVFVLDHIDGNSSNNKRDNLRMICPNCDSQLPTFKSKNKNSKRRNYLRELVKKKLLEELNNGL